MDVVHKVVIAVIVQDVVKMVHVTKERVLIRVLHDDAKDEHVIGFGVWQRLL